jgi:hypothetical protein
MTPSSVFRQFASSIAHIIIKDNGQRVSSGTGFLVNGHLVTCAHVLDLSPGLTIEVRFPCATPGQSQGWSYEPGGLPMRRLGYSAEHCYDYTILVPPEGVRLGPDMALSIHEPQVGEEVCGLGYPFEQEDLTLATGYVSSVYDSGIARILKLDMNVNPSNSGGPLIRVSDGSVVGVIARKTTGLSNAFDNLILSFDNNIEALSKAGGIRMSGFDPFEVFRVSQMQMKQVALELRRSAQVGIGHAIYVDPLRCETALGST